MALIKPDNWHDFNSLINYLKQESQKRLKSWYLVFVSIYFWALNINTFKIKRTRNHKIVEHVDSYGSLCNFSIWRFCRYHSQIYSHGFHEAVALLVFNFICYAVKIVIFLFVYNFAIYLHSIHYCFFILPFNSNVNVKEIDNSPASSFKTWSEIQLYCQEF